MNYYIRFFFKYILTIYIILLFTSISLKAENIENITQSLKRLENDVKDLQLEIYKDKKYTSDVKVSEPNLTNFSVFDLRIREIESQISQLTNYVEEYVFEIDKLNDRIDDLFLQQSNNLIKNENPDALTEDNTENKNNGKTYSSNGDQTLGTLSILETDLENKTNINGLGGILPEGSPDEQYQFAKNVMFKGKFNEAKIAFEEFIDKNNNHILAGSAKFWIGEIVYKDGNYKEAALIFAEGYQKYSESDKVPDMLFKLSISLSKIDRNEQACDTLNELITKHPNSILIKKARARLESSNCI